MLAVHLQRLSMILARVRCMFPFLQRQHLNRVGSNEPTPCRRYLTHMTFTFWVCLELWMLCGILPASTKFGGPERAGHLQSSPQPTGLPWELTGSLQAVLLLNREDLFP